MKTWLFIGGPLVLFTGFAFYSNLLTFGDQHPGVVHLGGVETGGTFLLEHEETYRCDEGGDNCVLVDEKTQFSEIDGLEIEEQPIEYRDGAEALTTRKQPGLTKFTNITMKRPSGFDWIHWQFMFDASAKGEPLDYRRSEPEFTESETHSEGGIEMIEIDPPVLTIPAQ